MAMCKVSGCRYPSFHVTTCHQCGKCKFFGHGQQECEDQIKKNGLYKYNDDILNFSDYCKVIGCKYPETHVTVGHCCLYCGKRENHMKLCPIIDTSPIFTDPRNIESDEFISNIEKNMIEIGHYMIKSTGMGCTWFVRNHNNKLEYIFMHSDSWGQYGEDTSDVPKLNCFCKGYKFQEEKNI